jgi:nucleoid-associated protein YgaU
VRLLRRRTERSPRKWGGGIVAGIPPISVRQPRPHDIVDDPVGVCGVGTGFEGVIEARVRAGNGQELKRVPIKAGGTGIWGNFRVEIDLPGRPPTPRGTLEVFEESQSGSGQEQGKVVVPIVFGTNLIEDYAGFAQYTVESGDTLGEIAQRFYGDPEKFRIVFQANRDQIEDPDLISPGQVLRIPQ